MPVWPPGLWLGEKVALAIGELDACGARRRGLACYRYADPLGLKTRAAIKGGNQSQEVPHRFVVSYCRFLAVGCGLNEIHCLSGFSGAASAFISVYQRSGSRL
jgi:hypothetical protein